MKLKKHVEINTRRYINTRLSGHGSTALMSDNDILADYFNWDMALFAYAGSIDATHVIPSGSTVKAHWAGNPGARKHYREPQQWN